MKNYWKQILIVIAILLIILAIILVSHNMKKIDEKDLKIYFFDAGKADACVISINDKHMMIDTGEADLYEEIAAYFQDNNINKLDYLIITHFDKDHVGSAAKIIDNFAVEKVFTSSKVKENEEYDEFESSIIVNKVDREIVTDTKSIILDDLTINIMGTNSVFDNNESNNSSLIVAVNNENNNFLFTADMQNARIKEYLSEHEEKYDFIKMPYHGNYLKRLDDLLGVVKPKYAVITSSDKEKEDEETTNLLKNLAIKYYLTRNGSITIRSNGNYIRIDQ